MAATDVQIREAFKGIFGVDGARLNALGQTKRTTVKVDYFYGTEAAFEKAATINRWIDPARKKAIVGGYLKGAAADWFEENTEMMGDNWATITNNGANFINLFN